MLLILASSVAVTATLFPTATFATHDGTKEPCSETETAGLTHAGNHQYSKVSGNQHALEAGHAFDSDGDSDKHWYKGSSGEAATRSTPKSASAGSKSRVVDMDDDNHNVVFAEGGDTARGSSGDDVEKMSPTTTCTSSIQAGATATPTTRPPSGSWDTADANDDEIDSMTDSSAFTIQSSIAALGATALFFAIL
jgi:hypothetical protein